VSSSDSSIDSISSVNSDSLSTSSATNFDAFFDFYKKIFTYVERSAFEKNFDKIASSESELGLYLDASSNSALLNKSYSYYFEIVEGVANSDWFKNQIGDILLAS